MAAIGIEAVLDAIGGDGNSAIRGELGPANGFDEAPPLRLGLSRDGNVLAVLTFERLAWRHHGRRGTQWHWSDAPSQVLGQAV